MKPSSGRTVRVLNLGFASFNLEGLAPFAIYGGSIESARTLRASRRHTYYRVIVPGATPEVRSSLLLSMGGGWSLAIAAEFLGYSSGLGYLADAVVEETNTALLLIVALIVALYSLTTLFLLNEGFKGVVSWMPQRATDNDARSRYPVSAESA